MSVPFLAFWPCTVTVPWCENAAARTENTTPGSHPRCAPPGARTTRDASAECRMKNTECGAGWRRSTRRTTETTSPILHSAFCTQHSALSILHSAFCTQHSAFCILHSALCTLHSVLCTLHSALCICRYSGRVRIAKQRTHRVRLYPQVVEMSTIITYYLVTTVRIRALALRLEARGLRLWTLDS